MKQSVFAAASLAAALLLITACGPRPDYDIIIRGGTIYDGSGSAPYPADLAISDDIIAAIGELDTLRGRVDVDAAGMAVAPGFINMLSWATESLIHDGRGQSDIRQGVTLEVLGEGWSMGPLNEEMKQEELEGQGDIKYDITWTTLGEYLQFLEDKGVSPNVASFLGNATVRIHEIGYEDRPATPEELETMKALVRRAMEEGAVGVSSALEYVPSSFASTEELIELARVAAEYGGMYVSHLRSEGDDIFPALDKFFSVVREAGVRGEIYHLKASRKQNWNKLDEVVRRIEAARAEGLTVTADMYTYIAGATGLDILMPDWVQEGGHQAWVERLKEPAVRQRLMDELNILPPEDVLLVSFRNEDLRHLTGKTLAEVAAARGTSAEETMMDLVIEDDSRVGIVLFIMSEENVRKKIALPWVAFCSDAGAYSPEGLFLNSNPHPRAYGSFARLLGKYVREEGIVPLEEAVRRLTSFPAGNLRLEKRGSLAPGYFADVVVFDPATITDHATFEQPHQYATGVIHVFVNGEQVLKDGEHTGATPGRFVRGPGWRPEN
ncbi:MAG: D-aminoacylase [Fidelibacterota bacterium]|nr:MAG: D-aminoacylase [Candidatus Neomarinimicrobiota bacterium]